MISRIAENCFYLTRNYEKVINIVQLIKSNKNFIMDSGVTNDAWLPVMNAFNLSCRDKKAIKYLVWQKNNPVSIFTLINNIRFNAILIRQSLSKEMWETINGFYLWINSKKSFKHFGNDQDDFFQTVLSHCYHFYGLLHKTMVHDEEYDFFLLGEKLEKVIQILNTVTIANERNVTDEVIDSIHWMSVLFSFSSGESFLNDYSDINKKNVIKFLLFDQHSPNSIENNLIELKEVLISLQRSHHPLSSLQLMDNFQKWFNVKNEDYELIVENLKVMIKRIEFCVDEEFFSITYDKFKVS